MVKPRTEVAANEVTMKRFWPTPTAPPLRVFVVEDHDDTRELLVRYLEGMGHTVFCATSMAEALEKLPGAECNVLISDIGLADGSGWELLQRLPVPHLVYAIAMSGFGMSADRIRSKEAGFCRHLLKPLEPDELDSALAEAAQSLAVQT